MVQTILVQKNNATSKRGLPTRLSVQLNPHLTYPGTSQFAIKPNQSQFWFYTAKPDESLQKSGSHQHSPFLIWQKQHLFIFSIHSNQKKMFLIKTWEISFLVCRGFDVHQTISSSGEIQSGCPNFSTTSRGRRESCDSLQQDIKLSVHAGVQTYDCMEMRE